MKTEICICLNPKGTALRKTRAMTYHSPKSVHNCDVWSASSNKPDIVQKLNLKWPLAAILCINVNILTRHLTCGSYLMQTAENGTNRINRFEVIRFFANFNIAPAAILDFKKCTNGAQRCLGDDVRKLGLKFGDYRSIGSEVIQILVKIYKIQNGAGGHFGF